MALSFLNQKQERWAGAGSSKLEERRDKKGGRMEGSEEQNLFVKPLFHYLFSLSGFPVRIPAEGHGFAFSRGFILA